MHWPPRVGEPLPRAAEAVGVRRKLLGYSLNPSSREGGPKARGFERILGITAADADYLEGAIHTGVLLAPIASVRSHQPWGLGCVVVIPVRGLNIKSRRVVGTRTAWLLADADSPPRLMTAFPRP